MYCMICGQEHNEKSNTVRNVNLYIIGSEGLDICHECEMRLVSYIRDLKALAATAKMIGVKVGKKADMVEW